MTDINLPTFTLNEPLRHRPFKGAVLGGLAGAMFGILAAAAFPVGRVGWFLGYLLGGLTAGAIIGLLLPYFRRRVLAGMSTAVAATCGFFTAMRFWPDPWTPELVLFCGAAAGFVYAILFWDYRAEK